MHVLGAIQNVDIILTGPSGGCVVGIPFLKVFKVCVSMSEIYIDMYVM